jgi:glycosyltransferase involved in cell wall biosynthesis
MTCEAIKMKKILVAPHSTPFGGAGIYTQRMIDYLSTLSDVTVGGRYAKVYKTVTKTSLSHEMPNTAYLPLYKGTKWKSLTFNLALLPWRALLFTLWVRQNRIALSQFHIIIFTSSVDLIHVAILHLMGINTQKVCVIQENLILTGLIGQISKRLLRFPNKNISITKNWSEIAKQAGVSSDLAPNPFDSPVASSQISEQTIDILYVGGSQKIKGFKRFIEIIESLAARRTVQVQILGSIDEKSKIIIAALNQKFAETGSGIKCVGFTTTMNDYYISSKILVMPISDPHFCRPAIEAGFCNRPFIVSDFDGMEDFAQYDYNCLAADYRNCQDWVNKIELLLTNELLRKRLGNNNYNFARRNYTDDAFRNTFCDLIATKTEVEFSYG